MADPMRVRAAENGGTGDGKILMKHDMESGQRKDAAGKTIPQWFISTINVKANGKDVFNILTQTVTTKISNYTEEETTGETSNEEWAISKSITSASYSLNCEEGAMISVDGNGMMVTPSGVDIIGPLIELN